MTKYSFLDELLFNIIVMMLMYIHILCNAMKNVYLDSFEIHYTTLLFVLLV